MGQLLPRPGHQLRQPPARPPRASSPIAAIVVRPDSPVYTPQQLANRTVGVPFYFGTHYLALHMLEGFLPRDHDQAVQRAQRLALSAATR